MTDEAGPAGQGIPKRFRDLSADVREERLIRYIVKQLSQGRHIDDIMSDHEIVAHTNEIKRASLMQNHTVLKAIEDEMKRQFSDYGSMTASEVDHSGPD
jgi:hypothetical protein